MVPIRPLCSEQVQAISFNLSSLEICLVSKPRVHPPRATFRGFHWREEEKERESVSLGQEENAHAVNHGSPSLPIETNGVSIAWKTILWTGTHNENAISPFSFSSAPSIFRIHGRIGYHEVVVLQGNGISFIVSLIGEQVVKSFG